MLSKKGSITYHWSILQFYLLPPPPPSPPTDKFSERMARFLGGYGCWFLFVFAIFYFCGENFLYLFFSEGLKIFKLHPKGGGVGGFK